MMAPRPCYRWRLLDRSSLSRHRSALRYVRRSTAAASAAPLATSFRCVYKQSITELQDGQFVSRRSLNTTAKMAAAAKYPTRDEITQRFQHLANGEFPKFFQGVSQDVDWTVMGTHPCAGHYKSLSDFQEATLKRLGAIMKPPGIKLKVRNVIGGGDQEWAVAELIAEAECKNGLDFDNTYAWCVRFDDKGTIVQVRAYLDSTLVKQAVEENECPSHRAPTGG